jgi:hypothetical protein
MKDVIELITTTTTYDAIGQEIKTESSIEVFAEKRPLPRVEFFMGGEHGLKPAALFVMREADYDYRAIKVRHEGHDYRIYRTYETKSEMIELYCEERSGV